MQQKNIKEQEMRANYLLQKNKEAAQKLLLAMRARMDAQEVAYITHNIKRD